MHPPRVWKLPLRCLLLVSSLQHQAEWHTANGGSLENFEIMVKMLWGGSDVEISANLADMVDMR